MDVYSILATAALGALLAWALACVCFAERVPSISVPLDDGAAPQLRPDRHSWLCHWMRHMCFACMRSGGEGCDRKRGVLPCQPPGQQTADPMLRSGQHAVPGHDGRRLRRAGAPCVPAPPQARPQTSALTAGLPHRWQQKSGVRGRPQRCASTRRVALKSVRALWRSRGAHACRAYAQRDACVKPVPKT